MEGTAEVDEMVDTDIESLTLTLTLVLALEDVLAEDEDVTSAEMEEAGTEVTGEIDELAGIEEDGTAAAEEEVTELEMVEGEMMTEEGADADGGLEMGFEDAPTSEETEEVGGGWSCRFTGLASDRGIAARSGMR